MSAINQKEYLKKYLSSDDKEEKKKKRKKKARPIERVKIIDDDIDLSQVTTFEEAADLLNTNEDAPQIVGVIDERPLHLRIDDYRKSELWKPLGDPENNNPTSSIEQKEITDLKKEIQYKTFRNGDNPSSTHKVKDVSYRRENNIREQIRNDCPVQKDDNSSHGKRSPQSKLNASAINNESSPPFSSKSAAVNDDNSPSRRKSKWSDDGNDTSPPRRVGDDFDNNLPRMNRNHNKSPQTTSKISVNNDSSPPRRSSKSTIVNDDGSPSRKQKRTVYNDNSPPRRKSRRSDDGNDASPPRRVRRDFDNSPTRRNRNHDKSPHRTSRISAINDDSSPRRNCKSTIDNDDNSPPRKQKRIIEDDNSPPRRKSRRSDDRNDTSLPRNNLNNSPSHMNRNSGNTSRTSSRFSDYDNSSLRKLKTDEAKTDDKPRKLLPGNKKGKYLIPAKRGIEKMTKTLDGKNAGLQNAQELIKETKEFRKREDDLFKNLSAEMSGVNATTIIRDKKTGKIRDLQKEAEEQKEKQKKEEENKEKYARWGRGLKQVEDYEDKLAQDLHEINKPLARYADDEDLEKFLKEQDREGDPMLDYIRKKRKKKVIKSGKPLKPEYEGEFMPNRFAIRPGHRWDGVDRSNGYEKKWFQIQNEKRAQQEEIYKWSTEDM